MSTEELEVPKSAEELIRAEAEVITDPDQISREIMDRIVQAETPEKVLEQAGTIAAEDYIGKPFVLTDARAMRSALDEGPGVYYALNCVDPETGEPFVMTCGGRNVLAQVFRLKQLDALPRRVKITAAGKTAQGYTPLWLNAA